MQVEIVAVGTELLLGQIVDTNSTWIAERLAALGVDCTYQTRVGDNVPRIVGVLREALGRADAIVICGGLGPTLDDVTREAIAQVMGVELATDPAALALVEGAFRARHRPMSPSNRRQADVPAGARLIEQRLGTAPGLVCPVGERVIFALPGVPDELEEMFERAVAPELRRRAGGAGVIASRVLRTWGIGESRLGELVAPRHAALEVGGEGAPTIAFLARGLEGVQLRVTVKTSTPEAARAVLDAEEAALRRIVGEHVFGVDEETMGVRIGALLTARNATLGVAESYTGGLVAAALVAAPGASSWFRGGTVAYASDLKRVLLGVPAGLVVSEQAAAAMADGARRLAGADFGLATTGVAGPDAQEGLPPGTAFAGLALPDGRTEAVAFDLFGDRQRVRELGTMNTLDWLRRRLEADRYEIAD
ncbi:MAG: competence/damage-inducible protein A [Acidimicrobiales bacterium]